MPTITVGSQKFNCQYGANLRQVLLKNKVNLYNGKSKYINCRGIGTCGTCAVKIEGEVSPPNWKDKTRRALPPHSPDKNLRLACQTLVLGDLKINKYAGFWGHKNNKVIES